jgi:hypothetical protein
VLLTACGDLLGVEGGDAPQDRLDAAEWKWDHAGIDDYVFTLRIGCFCGGPDRVSITVQNDVVVEVRTIPEGVLVPATSGYPTIRELFAILRDAIDLPAADVDADYHDGLGYPREIWVDWHASTADDEVSYEVSDLQASFSFADTRSHPGR